jgi:hypothetical protein
VAPVHGGGLTAFAPTGIELLDGKLGGGFVRPSTILLFSDHPSEKRLFAEHFITSAVKAGETCLYVDFFRPPQLARRELSKFGRVQEERLLFVDATSAQLLVPSEETYTIHDLTDLDHIMDTIERAIRETKPQRIVIDSMEFLADRFPKDHFFRRWRQLLEVGKQEESIVAYLFVNWTYGQAEVQQIEDMSDYVVEFRSQMKTGVLQHFLRMRHNRPGGMQTNWVPYTFKELVGLTVYFPRILVTGPFNAGKSTVVRALCNNAVSVDRMGTTVAFDYGNVEISGLEAEVFGTPGQERFDFIFQIFAREINGVLLVIDATQPEDFPRAKQMMDLVGRNTPVVVLANKSDLPGAMTAEEVRKGLDLPEGSAIVATVATEGRGIQDALKILAELVVGVR